MTPEEIAARWPEAVTFARTMRAVFGDGVKLIYAKNAAGEVLGRPSGLPAKRLTDASAYVPTAAELASPLYTVRIERD